MSAPPLPRRDLLALLAGSALAPFAMSRGSAGPQNDPEPDQLRISLAQWSLHRELQQGRLNPVDFPRSALKDHGIDAVEYVSSFYRDHAADFGHWRELRTRTEDLGVRNLLIMIDGEGALGAASAGERRRACERHFRWIAAAAFLGCHAIRVNAESEGSREDQRDRCAESLVHLGDVAQDYGLSVLVENHGKLSSDGAWLASVMRAANHPAIGTLPDFGNFQIDEETTYDRYRGLAELLPFARAVSAKSYAFDEQGLETTIDYARALDLVVESGYTGYLGIEFEGEGDAALGIANTKRLLERLLSS